MKKFFAIFVTCILLITLCMPPLSATDNGAVLPINFKIDSDSIPKEGGTFNASVFVESNFGFYSEILYIFYPDCLKVESVSPVLPSDTFADDSPFYSSKDVLCMTNNSKSVTSKIKSVAESTGFSLEVGDISEFLASGYKYSVFYMTCEQTRDENGGKKQFMNFKSVDGKLADYTFSYNPSSNSIGKTALPIYVVPSNVDSLYIDAESTDYDSVNFEPCGYVETARITEPSLYVKSETVFEGSPNAEISVFANFVGESTQIEAIVEIPPSLSFENITATDGTSYTFDNGILSFKTVIGGESADVCEVLKINFDTGNTPVGEYGIEFISCKANEEPLFADGGTLTVEKACRSGGYHIYKKNKIDASCTDDGYILLTCIKCGYGEKTDFEAATGHDFNVKSETQPSCDSFGVTVFKCKTCGIVEYLYSDPLEHNYLFVGKTVTTCLERSKNNYECELCGDTFSVLLDEYGEHSPGEEISRVEPKCTQSGEVIRECTLCKAELSTQISPLGHNYVLTEHVDATEISEGYDTYTCENCFDTYTETLEKPIFPGDVNGDGIISNKDCKLMKKFILNKASESDIVFANTDISGDGVVTSRDLRLLKAIISKK